MQLNTQIVDTLISQFTIEELEAMLLRKKQLQEVAKPKPMTAYEKQLNKYKSFMKSKMFAPIRR